jgi:methyl-accepting chemotaxis protein
MTQELRNLVKTISQSVEDMTAGTEEMAAAADQTAQELSRYQPVLLS